VERRAARVGAFLLLALYLGGCIGMTLYILEAL
jgi:hypothetical protein